MNNTRNGICQCLSLIVLGHFGGRWMAAMAVAEAPGKHMLRLRSLQEWMCSLPVFILLLTVVLAGNAEQIHSRLLHVGEYFWAGITLC